jgi:beta-glucanase (GH16 family)
MTQLRTRLRLTDPFIFILVLCASAFAKDRDLTGYTLVFEDNFDVRSVGSDADKGNKRWGNWPPYGPAGAFSRSHWAQSRLECAGGILRSWMVWNPDRNDQLGNNWESGLIASMDKQRRGFAQRFGYWSARMRMPRAGQGAWCAFWLASASGIPKGGSKGYEIDIGEFYGGQFAAKPGNHQYNWVVHPWNADGSQAPPPYEGGEWVDIPGGDAISEWHVYGCEVNPQHIIFYCDGIEVGRKPTHLDYLADPLYIIVNYALQDDHSGEPFASRGSSFMQIDWVRAYSLPKHIPVPAVIPGRK